MTDGPKEGEFRCDMCGGVFPKGVSDAEAVAESEILFGEIPPDERAVVCDACFDKFRTATGGVR